MIRPPFHPHRAKDMSGTIEHRVDLLERQVKKLRDGEIRNREWLDTIASPWYKKLYWWLQGYKWYTVGRWYGR